jgi:hypothetical protein
MTEPQLRCLKEALNPHRTGIGVLGNGTYYFNHSGEDAPTRTVQILIDAGCLEWKRGAWEVSRKGRRVLKEAAP